MNAALAVIDTAGIDRVTIRSVAKLAGAPPMSLYTHFTNKGELLELVYTEVWRRLYPDDMPETTWQADLFALCRHLRNSLIEHPRWIPLLARPVVSPPLIPLRERLLRQMVNDGLSPAAAMGALTSALITTIGLVLVDVTLREPDGQTAFTRRFERLRVRAESTTDHEHSVTRAAVSKFRRLNLEETFLLALRSLIAGLDVQRRSA
ncbi:MAG TPA: TetR/AcrR family transcriptional regulator [Polyangiaceae bacterium]